jgi:hypothetical protein
MASFPRLSKELELASVYDELFVHKYPLALNLGATSIRSETFAECLLQGYNKPPTGADPFRQAEAPGESLNIPPYSADSHQQTLIHQSSLQPRAASSRKLEVLAFFIVKRWRYHLRPYGCS